MSKKKFTGSVGRKGYYIALVLCAAAIGISGFLYYRNAEKTDAALSGNGETLSNVQNDQAVIATNPDGTPVQTEQNKPKLKTVSPLAGQTVAVYAMESLTYNQTTRDWRVHNGIDIAAEAGAEVCAAADGEVYTVYEDDTMGMTVVIRHADGYVTTYASLDQEVAVAPGDPVKAGQKIGCAGTSAILESAIGCHVHFSVTRDDQSVDPAKFLEQQ